MSTLEAARAVPHVEQASAWFTFSVLAGRDAASAARYVAADRTDWLLRDERFTVDLLLSEIVNNAVVHGAASPRAEIRVEGALIGDCLGIEVPTAGEPIAHDVDQPPADATSGRARALVRALAARWGTRYEDGRTTVWFELDLG